MRKIALLLSILFLFSCTSNTSTEKKLGLGNPALGYLPKKPLSKLKNPNYKYNLIYFDTRNFSANSDLITLAYHKAKSFGLNIKNGLLRIGDISDGVAFEGISKNYHDKYIKNKYSYNDGPFIIGLNANNNSYFIISLTGMTPKCMSEFYSNMEQAIRLDLLNKKVESNRLIKSATYCEVKKINSFNELRNFIDFIVNAYL